eukprot:sb/3469329/
MDGVSNFWREANALARSPQILVIIYAGVTFALMAFPERTPANILALDCEMVGVRGDGLNKNGRQRQENALARCSIVDYFGTVVYDKYIRPNKRVIDYRTRFSGVTKENMVNAVPFNKAKRDIIQMIRGKYVIGHDLEKDFDVLCYHPPMHFWLDTSKNHYLRVRINHDSPHKPSLKNLAKIILNMDIQNGSHDSIEDATTALELYKFAEDEWYTNVEVTQESANYGQRREDES